MTRRVPPIGTQLMRPGWGWGWVRIDIESPYNAIRCHDYSMSSPAANCLHHAWAVRGLQKPWWNRRANGPARGRCEGGGRGWGLAQKQGLLAWLPTPPPSSLCYTSYSSVASVPALWVTARAWEGERSICLHLWFVSYLDTEYCWSDEWMFWLLPSRVKVGLRVEILITFFVIMQHAFVQCY